MREIVALTRRDRWTVLYCDARGCDGWTGADKRYCSQRCQWREQAAKKRYRRILRRDEVECLACGVSHHEDGSVSLLNGGRRS